MTTHVRRLSSALLLAALLGPSTLHAAGAQLSIQQVQIKKHEGLVNDSLSAKAYVNVLGSTGSPIQGLSPDLFKIYEGGAPQGIKVTKVETLEAHQSGASIVIVVQASGAWLGIQDDVKKAVAAFINGLGEKDQVAVVGYAEAAETVAPFSAEKGDVAGKAGKLTFIGKSYLLYDGLSQALALYAAASMPGKGHAEAASAEAALLPAAKAIIVISDGRDNGSATDVEKVIADAVRRRIPIHGVGHSELDQDSLHNLEEIARRTGGAYKAASNVEEISRSLTAIKDYIYKMYVIQWKTELDHDGKEHKVDIAMENESGGASLRGSVTVKTPDFWNWKMWALITASILLVLVIAVVVYVVTRPKPPPPRFCPVCKREQMPDWEICLFCLKSAKARLVVKKGQAKGKVYPLVGKTVQMGSGPENAIRILDGAVSGKHAGVVIDDNKFEVVDLGSKNGVLVNGKKAARRFLRNGDVVTLGTTELLFESTIPTEGDEDDD